LKKGSSPQTPAKDAVLCKQLYAVVTKKKLELQDEKRQQIALEEHLSRVQEGHKKREERYDADIARLRSVAKEHEEIKEQLHQKVRVSIEKLNVGKASATSELQSYTLFVERCKTEEETLKMRFEEVMRENRQLKVQVHTEEEQFIAKKHETDILVKGIEYILQRGEMRKLDLIKLDEQMAKRHLEDYHADEAALDVRSGSSRARSTLSGSPEPGSITAPSPDLDSQVISGRQSRMSAPSPYPVEVPEQPAA
jgi:hypothetical protein